MADELDALPFDTVIVNGDGERRELDVAALLALPLHLRVRWLLDDSLEFFNRGEHVDRRLALAALRIAQLAGTRG